MKIYLLRHGQTTANVSGSLDTAEPGPSLTDLGRAQARAAADVLHERGVAGVFVSRLVRTHQTAAPLFERLGAEPTTVPGLEEIRAGDLELSTDPGDARIYLTTVASWIEGSLDRRMPGGENGHEFLERYDSAMTTIAGAGHPSALAVSHGAAIRAWTAIRAKGTDGEWRQPLHNTACLTLTTRASGWQLLDWNPEPVGGHLLDDPAATDPTGHTAATPPPAGG